MFYYPQFPERVNYPQAIAIFNVIVCGEKKGAI